MNGHHFFEACLSQPLTLAELAVGDAFIFFPSDGDDSGHGGFRGGSRLFVKIEPYHPEPEGGIEYHESFRYVAREVERPQVLVSGPLSAPVLKVVGVSK